MNFAIPDLYDFLRGPGFIIAVLVFVSGSVYRIRRLIRATRRLQRQTYGAENIPQIEKMPLKGGLLRKAIIIFKLKTRNTIFGTNPVMGLISLVFHLLLFITPVFLSAHNIIAKLSIGVSLFTIPDRLADIFTVVLIAIGAFFLLRRIFIPRVRMLSTFRDYFVLILVIVPFVSAFNAYHHNGAYHIAINIHMIIGEIAIMLVPFTSLVHMPFLIFSRYFLDSEYSIIPGERSW